MRRTERPGPVRRVTVGPPCRVTPALTHRTQRRTYPRAGRRPGNTFKWDEATGRWAFNLSTRPYTAAGTFTVTAVAGGEDYVLSPTCSNTFVRQ